MRKRHSYASTKGHTRWQQQCQVPSHSHNSSPLLFSPKKGRPSWDGSHLCTSHICMSPILGGPQMHQNMPLSCNTHPPRVKKREKWMLRVTFSVSQFSNTFVPLFFLWFFCFLGFWGVLRSVCGWISQGSTYAELTVGGVWLKWSPIFVMCRDSPIVSHTFN